MSHAHHRLEALWLLLLLHHGLEPALRAVESVAVSLTISLVHHQLIERVLAGKILCLELVLDRLLLSGRLTVLLRVEAVQHGVLIVGGDLVCFRGQGLAALREDVSERVDCGGT